MRDRHRLSIVSLLVALFTAFWQLRVLSVSVKSKTREDRQPRLSSSGKASVGKSNDGSSQPADTNGTDCLAVDSFFANEVWAKVGERTCLKCHNAKGEASESWFLLRDTVRDRTGQSKNRDAFLRMAKAMKKGRSRLLVKVGGGLDHGGGQLVIVIQSEMNRTPTSKNNNGNDHWSIGSVMFQGRGIKGNRVIGATDEKQFLLPVNPKTLATDKKGIRVRPEHIHVALRELAGFANHKFVKRFPLKVV